MHASGLKINLSSGKVTILSAVFAPSYLSPFNLQVLGGDSAVNGLVWVRGAKEEYDAFQALGSPEWNWKNFYAAMRKVICDVTCFLDMSDVLCPGRKFPNAISGPGAKLWIHSPRTVTWFQGPGRSFFPAVPSAVGWIDIGGSSPSALMHFIASIRDSSMHLLNLAMILMKTRTADIILGCSTVYLPKPSPPPCEKHLSSLTVSTFLCSRQCSYLFFSGPSSQSRQPRCLFAGTCD